MHSVRHWVFCGCEFKVQPVQLANAGLRQMLISQLCVRVHFVQIPVLTGLAHQIMHPMLAVVGRLQLLCQRALMHILRKWLLQEHHDKSLCAMHDSHRLSLMRILNRVFLLRINLSPLPIQIVHIMQRLNTLLHHMHLPSPMHNLPHRIRTAKQQVQMLKVHHSGQR
jgi:hypothetical protein